MVYCLRSRSLGSETPAAIYEDFNLLDDTHGSMDYLVSNRRGIYRWIFFETC